ncbi:PREDICTED: uncharacterized protein LOC109156171 isoform X1 [Ipomoea nil]|uniref:uncharacterized protein LOC109156171 isoform X1 n=2 Tax=Ipomoea nil TaxID=35883 RepID=UPI0009011440|nr:PREDICTED: uncharacterized protein LOC109156171 isoform X1 [Ipomoea nil]
MAFHVACPITCRKICYCPLGFPRGLQSESGKNEFLQEVARVEDFIKDPWLRKAKQGATIQVIVPKLALPAALGDGDAEAVAAAAQTKRATLQKRAAAASLVAEDYAGRYDLAESLKETAGDEQGQSNIKVTCRLCCRGDNEGSERARKMLSCKTCDKKYHRNCLKTWAQHRDLFHWSSWSCPSCRICEGCRRTGDPNKFMFCKRCDAAFHCYCLQPPHKNASSGPYLCTKHTGCYSCGSSVPGNGLSVRWFLGYTCCDACGRLFVKGNYCPVCLKVYRDSESTPMVCCDICQRWVHCQCDGISDEKYMQFQVDGNLQYACPTCRGECYQVRDLEDAVKELWRRRDEADKDLISSLRAAAGLPSQEEIFSISPFSDDEDSGGPPVTKNSIKFSLKGLAEKSPKKGKESGKKSSNKKPSKKKGEGHSNGGDIKNEDIQTYINGDRDGFPSPIAGMEEGLCSINRAGVVKHKFIDEVNGNRTSRTVQIKGHNHQSFGGEDVRTQTTMSKTTKGPKLVIHLGGRNKNIPGSPKSDASSCQKEQDGTPANGCEDSLDQTRDQKVRGKEGRLIKIKNATPEVAADATAKSGIKIAVGRRSNEAAVRTATEVPAATRGGSKLASTRHSGDGPSSGDDFHEDRDNTHPATHSKGSRTLLKLKFKNPYSDGPSAWAPSTDDEKCLIKGQRSKRKRPPPFGEKTSANAETHKDNSFDELMDANWILQKLGKDAVGKRVEVHEPSDNTWHRGKVTDFFEGTSVVAVALDDGKTENLELGKQAIRFVPQKQKRK